MSFDEFEKQVMGYLLRERTEQNVLFSKQYAIAKVISREFTGHGFFSDYHVPDSAFALPDKANAYLGCTGELEGVKHGIGFVLFVQNGVIGTLEGYVNGDEAWPETIGIFKLT
ncbi:MAG: hypothetical protein FWG50_06575 [Kiritimatiellaeota bacterium]|nr:hypothetical protein [Kiritimatiellota bacterium]